MPKTPRQNPAAYPCPACGEPTILTTNGWNDLYMRFRMCKTCNTKVRTRINVKMVGKTMIVTEAPLDAELLATAA